ncbi:MAG: hypothetical protein IPM24_16715 [Bryobacterales bacterium]|nr:hypothetical protein [Bryobacterales bacterium]
MEKMLSRGDVKGKLGRDDLPTPALLLDLDAFEHNVNKMAAHAKSHNRALRPHAKTHKCPEVANLAQLIESCPTSRWPGIQGVRGPGFSRHRLRGAPPQERVVMAAAVDTRRVIERAGISCPLLTGGSTGTYNIDTQIEGITELQPGSFVFMDIDYRKIGGQNGEVYDDFKNALTVLTTVVSKPTDDLAIVDGGFKAFATDRSFGPEPKNGNGIVYAWGGDEHGRVNVAEGFARRQPGRPHRVPRARTATRTRNPYGPACIACGEQEAVW